MTIQEIQAAIDAKIDTRQIVNMIADYLEDSPGGSGFPSSINQDTTVGLNGHNFAFTGSFGEILVLSPINPAASIKAVDSIGFSTLQHYSNSGDGYEFYLKSNNGVNTVTIEGDSVANELEYTAASHNLNGIVNVDGPLNIVPNGGQLRMKSGDGTLWDLSIDNAGALVIVAD